MNFEENPYKEAFIILYSWFIFLVWMNISFFLSVTDGSFEMVFFPN